MTALRLPSRTSTHKRPHASACFLQWPSCCSHKKTCPDGQQSLTEGGLETGVSRAEETLSNHYVVHGWGQYKICSANSTCPENSWCSCCIRNKSQPPLSYKAKLLGHAPPHELPAPLQRGSCAESASLLPQSAMIVTTQCAYSEEHLLLQSMVYYKFRYADSADHRQN